MKRLVHLEDDELEEDFLPFRQDLLLYERESQNYVLPSYNLALLKHMTNAALYLDALSEYVFALDVDWLLERPAAELAPRLEIGFVIMCERLWRWHTDVVRRKETLTSTYAVAYLLSWSSFVRAFHLTVYNDPVKLARYTESRADAFDYCRRVSHAWHVVVDDVPLQQYTIGQLWNSLRLIVPTLYAYAYSPQMKAYLHALFFRYCDLVSVEQDEPERVFDNPLFVDYGDPSLAQEQEDDPDEVELFDSFRRLKISVKPTFHIDNCFLYEGELLLYPQLHRMKLSSLLQQGKRAQLLQLRGGEAYASRVQTMIDSWAKMLSELARDGDRRTFIIDQFRHSLGAMYLFHGELERYKREFPDASTGANDVLSNCRPPAVARMNVASQSLLSNLVAAHVNALKKVLAPQQTAPMRVEALLCNELEICLLTCVSHRTWFKTKKVKKVDTLNGRFMLEELQPLEELDNALFLNRDMCKIPLLVKLVRVYYIVDTTRKADPRVLFTSQILAEAYCVWLALCVKLGFIEKQRLHHTIAKVVLDLKQNIL